MLVSYRVVNVINHKDENIKKGGEVIYKIYIFCMLGKSEFYTPLVFRMCVMGSIGVKVYRK